MKRKIIIALTCGIITGVALGAALLWTLGTLAL